jgi:hypothetical protein
MNNLLEEDAIIMDAFLSRSSDFLVGQNLRLEAKGKITSLFERSTSTVIAKIDFTHPIPLVKMRANFVGYEFLPQYLEAKDFVPCKQAQNGILEFRYYKLDGYSIQQTSINTLWKSFRKLITKNKQVKILYENKWYQITNIIHEDFTYVIKMLKGDDLTIAIPDLMMTWAEPVDEPVPSSGSSIWATGLMAEHKAFLPDSAPFEKTTKNLLSEKRREDFGEGLEVLSRDLKALRDYVEQLFAFISDDKKEQLRSLNLLTERIISLEAVEALNVQLDTIERIEEEQDWEIPNSERTIFNLTIDDSSRFEESLGGVTSLMMPLN